MIPKVIHYCWFGGNPMPKLARECIKSWKKYCPDFEIKEWNESNFDLDMYPYAREAYDAKKYAFVTDVVRLYALYHEGGVYMDTDVELLKPLTPFLHHHAFSGFEAEDAVPTGIMASEKGGKWAQENLEYYNNKHFLNADGTPDLTTNVVTITAYMQKAGLRLDNTFQDIEGLFTMYPKDYFCPKDVHTRQIELTPNSVCIHHFNMSWHSLTVRRRLKLYWFFSKFMNKGMASFFARAINGTLRRIEGLFQS